MTDKRGCRQIEFKRAWVLRVTVFQRANSNKAKGYSARKRIVSCEAGLADRFRWEISEQQDPSYNSG